MLSSRKAKPAYTTAKSRVNAAFGCLLHKKRTSVLQALVDADREEILRSIIPARSFSFLCQKAESSETMAMISQDLPMVAAAMYLGNFDGFRTIGGGEDRNDGSLHLAAMLALPKFVEWLLKRHSANYKSEEFERMIPLAMVCFAKHQPWCKIANEEDNFENRQLQTMKHLVPKTDLKWRHRNRTVLHFALESSLKTTQSMVEALNLAKDPEKNEKYLYKDKDGIEHSPDMYLEKLRTTLGGTDRAAMVSLLRAAGLKARYFKRVMPGSGNQQPDGYCGLPPDLERAWSGYS
jgi:hypothetical protein